MDLKPLDDALCVDSIKRIMEIFGGKWTFVILGELHTGTKHFNELVKKTGVSTKSLSDALKNLEKNGIVLRTVHPTVPVSVEYSLTDKGRDFENVFMAMKEWGAKWLTE